MQSPTAPLGQIDLKEEVIHGSRLVRLWADFAPRVATRPRPAGANKDCPRLSAISMSLHACTRSDSVFASRMPKTVKHLIRPATLAEDGFSGYGIGLLGEHDEGL